MAKIVADRVLETSTTTGTGAYTLAGAITGYISFVNAPSMVTGNTCDYYAEDVDASGVPIGGWETGLGTWSTGGILTRTTIYASSNAGAAVNWAAGTRRIGLGMLSASLVELGVSISDTAPVAPPSRQVWWDSSSGVPYIYYDDGTSSQWVPFVPAIQGSTGATGADLASFRNKLIGGHFDRNPWQRGTTFTVTASGTYVADRWRVDFDGTANITVSKVALAVPALINGVWCNYGLKFTVNSKSGNSYIRLSQRVEDVDTLTTMQSTLQTAILGSGSFAVPVNARQNFGTGGSPSADVVTPFVASLAITSSMQQLNTGLVVPTIAGKAYGTGLNDFLAVEYDLMNVPVSGYAVIALSGLEKGYVANTWEDRRRIELSLCQRYYEIGQLTAALYLQTVSTNSADQISATYCFKGTKRVMPVITVLSNIAGGTLSQFTNSKSEFSYTRSGAFSSDAMRFTWSADAEL